eukprot:TRINITY_DN80993_c0_g1_i1.p1 TRINITY_DN80993_c0_g1~~TRINITY_DN80993_c0_g1_i1.p1  ORF type:complete len:473 (-),score=113.28 TRINITY_DN80993_c0_g1_i1:1584-3002(-)
MSTFTIKNAMIPFPEGERGCMVSDVFVKDGVISAIGTDLPVEGDLVDGTDCLLLPGLVNAHTHSSEMWMRGEADMLPLEIWLAAIRDYGTRDVENLYYSALHTAVETLQTGGTTVVDHLFPLPGRFVESIEAAVRAYKDVGIRAFIGPLIDDLVMSDSFPSVDDEKTFEPKKTQEILENIEECIKRFHRPEEGIHIMVAPTGTHLCSDELFKGCIKLSEKYDVCRHIHTLETRAQRDVALEKYGHTAVEHMNRLGYLGPKTSMAHNIWLTDEDVALYAKSGSTAVHCPLSNLRLGSGISPVLKMLKAGVNVAFGCDGAASNDSQDLFEAIKMGIMLHNMTDPEYKNWINPHKALYMAALNGAKGLRLDGRIGSIEVGKLADLVLCNLRDLSQMPRTDPVGLLVLGRPVRIVKTLWIEGRKIIDDGKCVLIDEKDLADELYKRSEWKVTPRPSAQFAALEPDYRKVMGLDKKE